MLVFFKRGKTEVFGEKSRSKGVNQQQTPPTYNIASTPGFEAGSDCSEASALATTPPYVVIAGK